MKREIFDIRPEPVLDLGTGYYNIHLNVKSVMVNESDENDNPVEVEKFECDVVRVESIEYGSLVNTLIRKRYSIDEELALHRQRDIKNADFATYCDYCEWCKGQIRELLNLK